MSVERHLLKETLLRVPFYGNNTGACSMKYFLFWLRSRLECFHLMQFTWCLRTLSSQAWKACLVKKKIITQKKNSRCYNVCTLNRIRSPRLAAFGRIETRWVREVGKFGPYLRYKDWLRRRLLELMANYVAWIVILLIFGPLLFPFFPLG